MKQWQYQQQQKVYSKAKQKNQSASYKKRKKVGVLINYQNNMSGNSRKNKIIMVRGL